jgi:hypothetical protein
MNSFVEVMSMPRVTLYDVRRDIFNRFIEKPSRGVLEQDSEDIIAITYPILPGDSSRWSAHRLHINSKLLLFAGVPEALEEYLAKSNISANVLDSALLFTRLNIPVTIWVNTDVGNYFVAIDETLPVPDDGVFAEEDFARENYQYTYTLFGQNEFCELYRIPVEPVAESMSLIVLGNDITEGHYVGLNYEYHYAELPFFAVLEAIGAVVEWESPISALITLAGKSYRMNIARRTLIEVENYNFDVFLIVGNDHEMYYRFHDGELIVGSDLVASFLYDCGFSIRIDFASGVISIF